MKRRRRQFTTNKSREGQQKRGVGSVERREEKKMRKRMRRGEKETVMQSEVLRSYRKGGCE